MEKNSFSLFETVLALTILSILIGGFLKSSNFNTLSPTRIQTAKNKLILEDFDTVSKSIFKLTYTLNSNLNSISKNINNNKFTYNQNNIFFEKYTVQTPSINLSFKVFE